MSVTASAGRVPLHLPVITPITVSHVVDSGGLAAAPSAAGRAHAVATIKEVNRTPAADPSDLREYAPGQVNGAGDVRANQPQFISQFIAPGESPQTPTLASIATVSGIRPAPWIFCHSRSTPRTSPGRLGREWPGSRARRRSGPGLDALASTVVLRSRLCGSLCIKVTDGDARPTNSHAVTNGRYG